MSPERHCVWHPKLDASEILCLHNHQPQIHCHTSQPSYISTKLYLYPITTLTLTMVIFSIHHILHHLTLRKNCVPLFTTLTTLWLRCIPLFTTLTTLWLRFLALKSPMFLVVPTLLPSVMACFVSLIILRRASLVEVYICGTQALKCLRWFLLVTTLRFLVSLLDLLINTMICS